MKIRGPTSRATKIKMRMISENGTVKAAHGYVNMSRFEMMMV